MCFREKRRGERVKERERKKKMMVVYPTCPEKERERREKRMSYPAYECGSLLTL